MVFASPTFLFAFLPLALLLYYIVPGYIKNFILLLFSLFFYAWGEFIYALVLFFFIIINYVFGLLISKFRNSKWPLVFGIVVNLSLLLFFKYFNFLLENFGLDSDFGHTIHLPLGISFFTFQALSYLIDVYRDNAKPQKSILNLGLYISLFPQLIAGPIVRYNSIAKQLFTSHSQQCLIYGRG